MSRPQCLCDHHLFLDLLGPNSIALDLGAFEGQFAQELSRKTGARAIAIEANPRMFETIPETELVTPLNMAVAAEPGVLELFVGNNPLGTSVFSSHPESGSETFEVPATTLEQLIMDYGDGRLDLLKVNIEGAEIAMFDATPDAVLRAIGQITIQFHDFLPELNQAEDVNRIKARLRDLGFGEILFKTPNKDVLFVNLRARMMSPARFRLERAVVRARQYLRAAEKKLGR